jgi:hypothetical protein
VALALACCAGADARGGADDAARREARRGGADSPAACGQKARRVSAPFSAANAHSARGARRTQRRCGG